MNSASRKLALELALTEESAMAEAYRELKERLFGELEASTLAVAGLHEAVVQRRENHRLIQGVVRLLPRASGDAFHVSIYRQAEARLIQAFTLWRNVDPGWHQERRPVYIVGQRAIDRRGGIELLTISGVGNNYSMGKIRLRGTEAQRLDAWRSKVLSSSFKHEDIAQMFDHNSDKLQVNQATRGSIATNVDNHMFALGRDRRPLIALGSLLLGAPKCMLYLGSRDEEFSGIISDIGPSDDDMALFDVPTALSRLATAFGVSEQYETLLLDDPNGSSEE